MSNKKSQGMPINVLIIAILGFVVLIVLIFIFSGYVGNWARGIGGTCSEQGGTCAEKNSATNSAECANENFPRMVYAKGCPYIEPVTGTKTTDTNKAGQCCVQLR